MKSLQKRLKLSALKSRSSIKLCEEGYACKRSKVPSISYCNDCATYQCESCEMLLHEDERLILHVRVPAEIVSEDLLCDGDCSNKNYADVDCQQCKAKFCFLCDTIVHSEKSKKTHARSRFTPDTDEYLSLETNSTDGEENMFTMTDFLESELPDLISKTSSSKLTENVECFSLLNEKEELQVKSEEEFIEKLKCEKGTQLKVVSIFGNTGDGKSYTFNHTFFNGREVFPTSPFQLSCTVGVWAAFCKPLGVIAIDTEGFLGQSSNPNNRARMLLKILAISDVIVYRTQAERLYDDMFAFLGDASRAYSQHFSQELRDALSRCNIDGPLSLLGPAVIVFHQTINTVPYTENAELELRKQFHRMGFHLDAFSSLEYIGIQTNSQPTNFSGFKKMLVKQINNLTVRVARPPAVIYKMLKALCEKFSGTLDNTLPDTFPDQYFTCPLHCVSCNAQCVQSMNHSLDKIEHSCHSQCTYQHQYDNKILLCRKCFDRGERIVVTLQASESNDSLVSGLVKCAWKGYVLECSTCGVIYRSYEYWYGNKEPEECSAQKEICHVWPDHLNDFNISTHTAQTILDNIGSVAGVVSNISATPTQIVSDWVADKIAPTYWMPNSGATKCRKCERDFTELRKKHHCRNCGSIFCYRCSSKTLTLPAWGNNPVRVCDDCYSKKDDEYHQINKNPEVTARKIGEFLHSTVKSAINFPAGLIKSTARPTYWIPDEELTNCKVCEKEFSPRREIHHCRDCGGGVCNACSLQRLPVPTRGWKNNVRVCDSCYPPKT